MAVSRGSSWSREEVEATVADYLRMLRLELTGQPYNKAAHNRALLRQLDHRTRGAIELKHQNISAILLEQGFAYIPGYKPMGNYQQLLADVVLDQIEQDPALDVLVLQAVERAAVVPDLGSLHGIRVSPPRVVRRANDKPRDSARTARRATKRDYLLLESRNRSLGLAGEQFIAEFEARRLHAAGQKSLAERVEHVAGVRGDGLGYDVLSFEVSGEERFLEVKTTDFGASTPFYVSRNEVAFSEERSGQFILARVHEFRSAPKFFELKGSIRKNVLLDAVSFVARL
ncbi:MAG TPA: DUF3883 domain-containing protein [Steroidobacteraceae bacterium]|nr:DUF3883 domain-containing protein [Steroidobacteraceae bacterium]